MDELTFELSALLVFILVAVMSRWLPRLSLYLIGPGLLLLAGAYFIKYRGLFFFFQSEGSAAGLVIPFIAWFALLMVLTVAAALMLSSKRRLAQLRATSAEKESAERGAQQPSSSGSPNAIVTRPDRLNTGLMLVIFVVTVIALGGLLAGQYLASSIPASPDGPVGVNEVEDTGLQPFLVRWGAREGLFSNRFSAPMLALRLRSADIYGWDRHRQEDERSLLKSGKNSEQLMLGLEIPGGDGFAGLTPKATHGAMVVYEHEEDDQAERLLKGESQFRRLGHWLNNEKPASKPATFWLHKDSESGRRHIMGRVCPSKWGGSDHAREVWDAFARAEDPRLRCFMPKAQWKALVPGLFGYSKVEAIRNCKGSSICGFHFMFQGRHVAVRVDETEDKYFGDEYLFISAWEALERMRVDALRPASESSDFTYAREIAETCQQLILSEVSEDSRPSFNSIRACEKAEYVVSSMHPLNPSALIPALEILASTLFSRPQYRVESLAIAWLDSFPKLSASEKDKHCAAVVKARVPLQLRPADPLFRNAMAHILAAFNWILEKDSGVSLEEARMVYRLWHAYQEKVGNNEQADAEIIYQWLAKIAQLSGPDDERMTMLSETLRDVWNAQDYQMMRAISGQMRETYLQMSSETVGNLSQEKQAMLGMSAFGAILGHWIVAFKDAAFEEMEPGIRAVVTQMETHFGPENIYVKAAKFQEKEVLQRKWPPVGQPGGGYVQW